VEGEPAVLKETPPLDKQSGLNWSSYKENKHQNQV